MRGIPLSVLIHKCSAYTLIQLISHSIHRQGMWDRKRDSKHLSLFWRLMTSTLSPTKTGIFTSSWILKQLSYDALCCVPWEMKPQHGMVRDLVFRKEPLWAFGITLQFLLMPGFPHPGLLLGNAYVWILSLERRVFWEVSGCAVPADFSGFSEWSLASGPWFLAPWAVSQSVCLQRHLSPFRSDLTMQINLKINRDHPHLLICCVGSILEEVWINRNCCLPSAEKSVDWCQTWQIMRSLGKSLFSKFQKIDPEVQGVFFFFFILFDFFFLAFACLFIFFFWASATPIIFLNGLCKHARWERIGGGSSSSWNWYCSSESVGRMQTLPQSVDLIEGE